MARAGSRCLSIFTHALNARIIRAYAEGPLRAGELEEALGWAPQSSLRVAVGNMCKMGVLARVDPADDSPGAAIELTATGRELLPVADALERWLESAPGGPISLDDPAAHGTIRVLAAGWDSDVIRALAERPQTLAELDAGNSALNYPALKRRLAKLRSTRLVIPVEAGGTTAYAASEWLRRAIAPLVLAGRWERRHDPGAQSISPAEVEASFFLVLPLVELPHRVSGACSLAVMAIEGRRQTKKVAGVSLEVEEGQIASCVPVDGPKAATWALGTVDAWLEAVIEGRRDALRVSGAKPRLAESIVAALYKALFGPIKAAASQSRTS